VTSDLNTIVTGRIAAGAIRATYLPGCSPSCCGFPGRDGSTLCDDHSTDGYDGKCPWGPTAGAEFLERNPHLRDPFIGPAERNTVGGYWVTVCLGCQGILTRRSGIWVTEGQHTGCGPGAALHRPARVFTRDAGTPNH
jgi:hypothetical protein